MAIKSRHRGFALFVAIVFMSVMLAFGVALASAAYKQQILSSTAVRSQYAFYAADAALECALHADQKQQLFDYADYPEYQTSGFPSVSCDGASAQIGSSPGGNCYNSGSCVNQWISSTRVSLDSGTRCADITVYKANPGSGLSNFIFAQGYDTSCATVANPGTNRFVARGISVRY